jgi:hypothetical protein
MNDNISNALYDEWLGQFWHKTAKFIFVRIVDYFHSQNVSSIKKAHKLLVLCEKEGPKFSVKDSLI